MRILLFFIVFWNLENFFDYRDDATSFSDTEFSASGQRRWTKSRFFAKCDHVAKSLFWIGDKYGEMPEIIGLAEVENRTVLSMLINSTLLKKYDYEIVHFDSKDSRGIDVALLYRKNSLEMIGCKAVEVEGLRTRDILCVNFLRANKTVLDVLVNHHPSKYGGSEKSQSKRETAMGSMMGVVDSLQQSGSTYIVCMGDFNDNPQSPVFDLLGDSMENKADSLHQQGQGTIKYEGKWDMIDMFIVSSALSGFTEMEIVNIPFLMENDKKHCGMKPLRTYSGPRYKGGVSDHCPIVLKCKF